jgi:DNA adenine methylase
MDNPIVKPILKWVGGKTQIIDTLLAKFPENIDTYHEIFLGGGSVLLAALSRGKLTGKVYAYDLNPSLIGVYKNIQTSHELLWTELQSMISEFNKCGNGAINRKPKTIEEAMIAKENYYYWIRNKFNTLKGEKVDIPSSALFIFLNKTCFRGMYRVNSKGEFNVPYGNYANPEIINKEHLDKVHLLIRNVEFECCDFRESLNRVKPNNFVYLDPPYAPETTKSFVGYNEGGFNVEDNLALYQIIRDCKDIKIMMSNSDVPLVRENFVDYNIESILCKRSINSKKPESKAKEVIITNFTL